jgi:uncharacterized FAD-dependent dehydrogenase
MSEASITAASTSHKRIYALRALQVMLDEESVELSLVESRTINKAVNRNIERFPSEFMFQQNVLAMEMNRSQFVTTSKTPLTSQNVSLKTGRGQHRKYFPMHLLNSVMQYWRWERF